MFSKLTSPIAAVAALFGAGMLGACNTVEGVGEDVEAAGSALEREAEEANPGGPDKQ